MFGLNKLADKNFIIGFVLPVLIFSVATAGLFHDTKAIGSIYNSILQEQSFTSLSITVLAVWTAATLLMVWNHSIYQILEGYGWPFNRESWREHNRTQFLRDRYELRNMRGDESDYVSKSIKFRERYPFKEELVLPTRFGNVVRAFETYSLAVYGADAIRAWNRLVAVIPKDFASQGDDARAQVDFWINGWTLALLFAGLAAGRALWSMYTYSIQLASKPFSIAGLTQIHWEFVLFAAIAVGIAFSAYKFAIGRALEWGELVKSAFDLYLPALAKSLGYELPSTRKEQIAFWDDVNALFLFHRPLDPERWPRAAGKAVARGISAGAEGEQEEVGKENDEPEDGTEEVEEAAK